MLHDCRINVNVDVAFICNVNVEKKTYRFKLRSSVDCGDQIIRHQQQIPVTNLVVLEIFLSSAQCDRALLSDAE